MKNKKLVIVKTPKQVYSDFIDFCKENLDEYSKEYAEDYSLKQSGVAEILKDMFKDLEKLREDKGEI